MATPQYLIEILPSLPATVCGTYFVAQNISQPFTGLKNNVGYREVLNTPPEQM
jgi:hypothetical protein